MPALKNERQERFCQLVKQGIPPYRAYPQAGYNAHDGAPYRLCGNVRVKRRLAELTRGLRMKTQVTVESLTQELEDIAAGAAKDSQWGAAKGAVETKAKLHGLLVERKESGAPGEFAGLTTPEAVIAAIRQEMGNEAADALAAMVGKASAAPAPAPQQEAEQQPIPTVQGSGSIN